MIRSHCGNGGCKRPIYRGRVCFRCWAGIKWTSIIQRVNNVSGHCPTYVGIPVGFTKEELIQWVLDNPPPKSMETPSIDRIIPKKGYVPGNIRWLEKRKNATGMQRDLPEGKRGCPKCEKVFPDTLKYFGVNNHHVKKKQTYCRSCKLKYDRAWREKHAACA